MSLRMLFPMLLLVATPAVSSGATPALDSGELPEYHAGDPDAAIVTEASLATNERFWPYHVGLIRAWQPEGREAPLPLGTRGVLIRADEAGQARIDFGRDGLFEVPVEATDLVELANRVRRGELEKMAPNYVLAIGPRLVDAAADPPRGFPFREVGKQRAFLSVFADPQRADFESLAEALAPLRQHAGLMTILFPQGGRPDSSVYERVRAADWPVPFVHDHLTQPYTNTLLPDGIEPPAILVQTPEGRVLFQRRWTPELTAELLAAIDRAVPVEQVQR
jgi:hypothetical protein